WPRNCRRMRRFATRPWAWWTRMRHEIRRTLLGDLPDRGGREQRGRPPGVIWQDTTTFSLPTVLVISLTTNPSALRFPGTVPVQPPATNGLTNASAGLVF